MERISHETGLDIIPCRGTPICCRIVRFWKYSLVTPSQLTVLGIHEKQLHSGWTCATDGIRFKSINPVICGADLGFKMYSMSLCSRCGRCVVTFKIFTFTFHVTIDLLKPGHLIYVKFLFL